MSHRVASSSKGKIYRGAILQVNAPANLVFSKLLVVSEISQKKKNMRETLMVHFSFVDTRTPQCKLTQHCQRNERLALSSIVSAWINDHNWQAYFSYCYRASGNDTILCFSFSFFMGFFDRPNVLLLTSMSICGLSRSWSRLQLENKVNKVPCVKIA